MPDGHARPVLKVSGIDAPSLLPEHVHAAMTGTRVVRPIIARHCVRLASEAEQRRAGDKAEQKRPHDHSSSVVVVARVLAPYQDLGGGNKWPSHFHLQLRIRDFRATFANRRSLELSVFLKTPSLQFNYLVCRVRRCNSSTGK
jgi:hypothetical protein